MYMHRSTWFHTGIYLIDAQDEQERLKKEFIRCTFVHLVNAHIRNVHLLGIKPSPSKTVNISKSNQLHLRSWKTTDDAAAAAAVGAVAVAACTATAV